MKKNSWITMDCFIDTDLPIIKTFKDDKQFTINWYIFFSKNRMKKYDPIDIKKEIGSSEINIEYIFF